MSDKDYMSDEEYVANIPNLSNKKLIDGLEWCGHDNYYNVMYYPIVEEIKKRLSKERTAKVKIRYQDESIKFGFCECGQGINSFSKYCPECGCKLDWSGNDD